MYSGKHGGLLMSAVLGGLATLAGSSAAQEAMHRMSHIAHAASPAGAGKYQVKSLVFKLPFKLDQRTLASMQEMQLWSCDDKGVWMIMDRVSPAAGYFTCRVAQNGEYGFSIVSVDAVGKVTPADVTRRPPELQVVVHSGSQAPALPLSPLVVDANPVSAPLVSPEAPPIPLSPLPASAKKPAVSTKTENQPDTGPTQAIATQPMATETTEIISETPLTMSEIERLAGPEVPASPAPEAGAQPEHASQPEAPALTETLSGPAPVSTSTTILINNTQVSVDYNINRKGPSGVSKVEIYGTTDHGCTWKRFGEDADRISPADVTLPGEGTFGLRLVGINGNGFGKPPAAGVQPTTNIEVDSTRPKIQSWKVTPIKNGKLDIQWLVLDKNLGNAPVNLYYAHDRNGPWKPLCRKLKGEANFHGPVPSDAGDQITIRVEAIDLAGNVSTCESQEPLIVDRMEPEINVVGITVTPRTSTSIVPTSK